ncbi:MAG: hypothetical protein ACRECQ_08240, partial [Burkholderiaceae bacterium]
ANRAVWHRGQADEAQLRKLIEDHHRWTGSLRARHILDHWAESRAKFVKVFPHEYRRALQEMAGRAALADQADSTLTKARMPQRGNTVPAK